MQQAGGEDDVAAPAGEFRVDGHHIYDDRVAKTAPKPARERSATIYVAEVKMPDEFLGDIWPICSCAEDHMSVRRRPYVCPPTPEPVRERPTSPRTPTLMSKERRARTARPSSASPPTRLLHFRYQVDVGRD